ncbi:sugar kinase [Streptomyces sp. ODS28]|uniref:sugar kinase n=1 Tax=Streptomyces sp. ODS28 TaxID=3136688 RepID=UPI0031EB5149
MPVTPTQDHGPEPAPGPVRAPGPAPEVLCLGESMVLLTPPAARPLGTAHELEVKVAGAESTVAQYLADLGHRAAWASRLGADPLGEQVLAAVRAPGVDVSPVVRDPDAPTGVYFKDPGPHGTRVHYYRAGSAASRMTPDCLDSLPLASCRLVHVSGITPALSPDCARTTAALLRRAREAGVTSSFDVNYRPALWRTREEAAAVLLDLARQADVVFVGLDEAQDVWSAATHDEVRELLGGDGELVVKDAAHGATGYEAGAREGVFVAAPRVEVVEPVGAGDAFAAGHLSARLHGVPMAGRLARGHRVAAFALSSTEDHADARSLRGELTGEAPAEAAR